MKVIMKNEMYVMVWVLVTLHLQYALFIARIDSWDTIYRT